MRSRKRTRSVISVFTVIGAGLLIGACGARQPAELAPGTTAATATPTLTAAQRQAILGTYAINTSDGRYTFRIFEQDGEIMGQVTGQSAVRLTYEGNNVFRTTSGTPYSLTFVIDGGRANRVSVRSPSETAEAVRVE